MIYFIGMTARLDPGTKIKAKKGHLGYLVGEKCYAVKAVLYVGNGLFRPFYPNGKLNTKAAVSVRDYRVVQINSEKYADQVSLLIEKEGCILQFIDGYIYLEDVITDTMERHKEIEYDGHCGFYSNNGEVFA